MFAQIFCLSQYFTKPPAKGSNISFSSQCQFHVVLDFVVKTRSDMGSSAVQTWSNRIIGVSFFTFQHQLRFELIKKNLFFRLISAWLLSPLNNKSSRPRNQPQAEVRRNFHQTQKHPHNETPRVDQPTITHLFQQSQSESPSPQGHWLTAGQFHEKQTAARPRHCFSKPERVRGHPPVCPEVCSNTTKNSQTQRSRRTNNAMTPSSRVVSGDTSALTSFLGKPGPSHTFHPISRPYSSHMSASYELWMRLPQHREGLRIHSVPFSLSFFL